MTNPPDWNKLAWSLLDQGSLDSGKTTNRTGWIEVGTLLVNFETNGIIWDSTERVSGIDIKMDVSGAKLEEAK